MIRSEILRRLWPKAWTLGLTRNVAVWADKHRRLTKHSSQYAGRWKTSRFPYQKGVMDAFSSLKTRLIVLSWATQTGKTELQLNCMGYAIDEQPGPILVVLPSEKIVKKVSTTRIQPMINSADPLRQKKHPSPDKFKIEEMHFLDCICYLASAQTPGDLASMPIQYLFADEVGKFPTFSGKEGDPVKLAMERQKAFPFTSKTVLVSSPTTPDGPISRYYNSCQEQLQYFVSCPHCQTMQILDFDQIKWDTGGLDSADPQAWREAKRTAFYFCPSCGAAISDQEKVVALQVGEWLREDGTPPDPEAESMGFKLSSLYSPLITWGSVAAEFLQAKQDPASLMVFLNGWLCKEWEDSIINKKKPDAVLTDHLTDLPPQTAPEGTWVLTMGIDSQATGFYFVVRAWLRDRTSYLIDYGFLPSLQAVGEIVFEKAYPLQGTEGRSMVIWRAAIDTGGTRVDSGYSMTEEVYQWLRYNGRGVIHGIKGASWKTGVRVQQKLIDKMPGTHGKPIPGGLTLFLVDVSGFKEVLHYRLNIDRESPGAFLFHAETTEKYTEQLLSEYKRRDTRTGKESWVQVRGRENHFLDCEIYSLAATDTQFLGGIDLLHRPQGIISAGTDPLTTLDPPVRKRRAIFKPQTQNKRW